MNLDSGKGSPFEFFTTNSWTHRGALIHDRRARARERENTENEKENVLACGFRIKFYSLLAGARGRAEKFLSPPRYRSCPCATAPARVASSRTSCRSDLNSHFSIEIGRASCRE